MSRRSYPNSDQPQQVPPTKKARTTISQTSNLRSTTACEKCRNRKTKCDNIRPACGYCSKHDITCVYPDDAIPVPWEMMGERILTAIDELSRQVAQQNQYSTPSPQQHRLSAASSQGHSIQSSSVPVTPHPQHLEPPLSQPLGHRQQSRTDHRQLQAHGVEETLTWDGLEAYRQGSCLFFSSPRRTVTDEEGPSISPREMYRLTRRYIDGVHAKNPILDIQSLLVEIRSILNRGLAWNTSTCLVMLVCAIGAITELADVDLEDISISPYDSTSRRNSETTLAEIVSGESKDRARGHEKLSRKYFSIAQQRMGLAIDSVDFQGVQCLCLAGIYYMNHLETTNAWKYFNLAATAWISVDALTSYENNSLSQGTGSQSPHNPSFSQANRFTLMQSLYFTIWKSECEIRMEIDLPGGLLEDVKYPLSFPSPPKLDQQAPQELIDNDTRLWFYYLAEIAARHLLNRISRSIFDPTNENDLRRLITQADTLQEQVEEWRSSLPQLFCSQVPFDGAQEAEEPTDEISLILRYRYWSCLDLISRPFVKFCVHQPFECTSRYRSRVVEYARQNIRVSMLQISQQPNTRHQGTWTGIRLIVSKMLVFIAIEKAKLRHTEGLIAAIELPVFWRRTIVLDRRSRGRIWEVSNGGVDNLKGLADDILAEGG